MGQIKFTHRMGRTSCLHANPGLFEVVFQERIALISNTSRLSQVACCYFQQIFHMTELNPFCCGDQAVVIFGRSTVRQGLILKNSQMQNEFLIKRSLLLHSCDFLLTWPLQLWEQTKYQSSNQHGDLRGAAHQSRYEDVHKQKHINTEECHKSCRQLRFFPITRANLKKMSSKYFISECDFVVFTHNLKSKTRLGRLYSIIHNCRWWEVRSISILLQVKVWSCEKVIRLQFHVQNVFGLTRSIATKMYLM